MAWSNLANNQLVNGDNLVGSGLTAKSGQTLPTGNKILTRAQANTLLNITPIPNDNKGVKKSELIGQSTLYATRLWFGIRDSTYANFSSEDVVGQSKLGTITPNSQIVYSTAPLANGVNVYYDSAMTLPVVDRFFMSDGTTLFLKSYNPAGTLYTTTFDMGSNVINNLYSFPLHWSATSALEACQQTSNLVWGFNTSPILTTGLILQHDTSEAQYISHNNSVYRYEYGLGITSIDTCGPGIQANDITITVLQSDPNSSFTMSAVSSHPVASTVNIWIRVTGDISGQYQDCVITFYIGDTSAYSGTILSGLHPSDNLSHELNYVDPLEDDSFVYQVFVL